MKQAYRVQVLDADGVCISEALTDLQTIDGVLVFQCDQRLSDIQENRMYEALTRAFPTRKALVLTEGVRLVRLVPVAPDAG